MIRLAYCNVENLDLKRAYGLLPKDRQDKMDFYRFDRDKRLSAGAYLLLEKLLALENIENPAFKRGKYDKPYISNHDDIHFNLSHSRSMVLCAISDMEVGVDIEYVDSGIDLNIAKLYFYNSEYENIMDSTNPADEFFRYWVLKESYMKYTGLGMNLSLDSFEIVIDDKIDLKNNDDNLTFNLFEIEGYKIAVAGHFDATDLTEFSVDELY